MTDSELAVEPRVKNPFTIDRFSSGKLLCAESFSGNGGFNSHAKTRFQVILSYSLDSEIEVKLGELRFARPLLTLPRPMGLVKDY
jgi:hypothetical protein